MEKGMQRALTSIVSYPERGKGGKSSYRGNCPPNLVEDLIDHFGWTELSDYMCGSGTVEDVCARKGIASHCYDLNRGFDLMTMDIPERNEAIFWHPPYGDMIQYSDSMYSSREIMEKHGFDPSKSDLSRIHDWDEFIKALNYCCLKQYSSLEPGGRMAVLMGDMKRKGRLYSMICDIVKPGAVENIVIKAQHNCTSSRKSYTGKPFIPIVHEYLLLLRKDAALVFPISYTKKAMMDLRNTAKAPWKDVVAEVMYGNRAMHLSQIYAKIEGHARCKGVSDWQAKVRQTLQTYPFFESEAPGVWVYRPSSAAA